MVHSWGPVLSKLKLGAVQPIWLNWSLSLVDYRPHKTAEPKFLKDAVPPVHKPISAGRSDRM